MRNYINLNASTDECIIVGLDVHKDSISACVLDRRSGEILWQSAFANERSRLHKFIKRLRQRFGEPRCCYEASCCGFALYRQLKDLGVACDVIAPSSIPRRSGDRAGNDRIDAEKLSAYHASGLLTPVDVPDQELEATRALLRCRGALVEELTRAKNRTTQFLLTRGLAFREGTNRRPEASPLARKDPTGGSSLRNRPGRARHLHPTHRLPRSADPAARTTHRRAGRSASLP